MSKSRCSKRRVPNRDNLEACLKYYSLLVAKLQRRSGASNAMILRRKDGIRFLSYQHDVAEPVITVDLRCKDLFSFPPVK